MSQLGSYPNFDGGDGDQCEHYSHLGKCVVRKSALAKYLRFVSKCKARRRQRTKGRVTNTHTHDRVYTSLPFVRCRQRALHFKIGSTTNSPSLPFVYLSVGGSVGFDFRSDFG